MNTFIASITNTIKQVIVQQTQTTKLTKEQFVVFRNAFKRLACAKRLTTQDIIYYNVIRDLPIDRGFTPITNKNKLFNGMRRNNGLEQAKWRALISLRSDLESFNSRFDNFLGIIPPRTPIEKNRTVKDAIEKQSSIAAEIYETIRTFELK